MKYPMIPIALFLSSGIFLSDYITVKFSAIDFIITLAILLMTLCFVLYTLNRNISLIKIGGLWVLIFCFFAVLGLFVSQNSNNQPKVFTSQIEFAKLKIDKVLKSNDYQNRYYSTVFTGQNQFKSLVYQDKNDSLLKIGDRFQGVFVFDSIKKPLNPVSFSYQKFLSRQNIYFQTTLNTTHEQILSSKDFFSKAEQFRQKCIKSFDSYNLSDEHKALIAALLFGYKNDLPNELLLNYKRAGVMHLLAISGLHIGIICFCINFLISFILPNKKARLLIVVLVLIGFVFISGFGASVIRSVLMFVLIALGVFSGSQTKMLSVLSVAFFLTLLVWPQSLFDVGFQLSYLAVFSIVWLYPAFQRKINNLPKMLQYFAGILAISIVVQLGLSPLLLYHFKEVSLLFLVSNLIAIPLITIVLIFSVVLLPLNFVSDKLGSFFAEFLQLILNFINNSISFVASFESFYLKEISFTIVQLFIGLIALFLLGCKVSKKYQFHKYFSLGVLVLFFQLIVFLSILQKKNLKELILFYDYQNVSLVENKGGNLHFVSNDSLKFKSNHIRNYIQNSSVNQVSYSIFRNVLFLKKKILLIDESGIFPKKIPADYIILKDNPNIDFEDLTQKYKQATFVFHPKNPKWRILYWQQVCKQKKIPFHDLSEKGFLKISM